jgi:GNAT superfamily N-acetyltransferase
MPVSRAQQRYTHLDFFVGRGNDLEYRLSRHESTEGDFSINAFESLEQVGYYDAHLYGPTTRGLFLWPRRITEGAPLYSTSILVYPDHEGQGLASALTDELVAELRNRGAVHIIGSKPAPDDRLLLGFLHSFLRRGYRPAVLRDETPLNVWFENGSIFLVKDYAEKSFWTRLSARASSPCASPSRRRV